MSAPRYVLIANPGTKRCDLYRRELATFWLARGVMPDMVDVPWAEVVSRDGRLEDLPAFESPGLVRLESPGKDDTVTRRLLEAGSRDDPGEPPRDWRTLPLPKGLLIRPGLLYRGFRHVLHGLKRSLDARPHLTPTACPLAVAEMFDKTATCRKLSAAGVPVPEQMPPAEVAVLNELAIRRQWPSAYVKLNTGASATGMVVLHPGLDGRPVFGVTTLTRLGGQFFNTRRVHRASGDDLEAAVDFVRDEGAIVQRGIPMAQADGGNFDVRVVCVYGAPAAMIFRISPHPMTNLHLGGRRGDLTHCRATIPTREWLDALDLCADAAGCFDSAVAGVDVVFERGSYQPFILEVNAFGDFFPGWNDSSGRSVHHIEIEATARRNGFLE